jgi:large subunit ribosomal protein L13
MKTYTPKADDVTREWHVIDASGKILGKLAVEVARLLRGKHKPMFSPHFDVGDFVVVINAEKVRVTGKKKEEKIYYHHSGYPGGLKSITFAKIQATHPTRIIELAVKGMLPHNSLGRAERRRLKVYAGGEHPHQAQVCNSQRRRCS